MIFLENVKGFAESSVLKTLKKVLRHCGYVWRSYLLSPISSVGVPNHRMRFYMTIEHRSSVGARRWLGVDDEEVLTSLPSHAPALSVQMIENYINNELSRERREQLVVPSDVLQRNSHVSVVTGLDRTSYCFTKVRLPTRLIDSCVT